MNLLVVNNVVANAITGPLSISRVGQDVLNSCKNCHRNRRYVLERNKVGVSLLVTGENVGVLVWENLESVLLHVLGVVEDGFDRGTVGLVAHVDCEAVIVVKFRVLVNKELGNQFAQNRDVAAEKRTDGWGEPIGS